jgi:group I intron endonuclease
METFHIYAIVNLITQDAYVGCTTQMQRRVNGHRHHLRSGAHSNAALQAAWNRDGEDAFQFSVVATLEGVDQQTALRTEGVWIAKIGTYNEMGQDEMGRRQWSDEMRENMSRHTARRWADPELRKPLAAGLASGNGYVRGMKSKKSPEQHAEHSTKLKAAWADPEKRQKLKARQESRWNDPAAKERQAEKMRAYHARRRALET